MRACYLLAVLLLASLSAGAQEGPVMKPRTYPQLSATRYAAGATLPAGVKRPSSGAELVDKAKLPPGATVLSAARGRNGVVWTITDKGAFRAEKGRYSPLGLPKTYRPRQPLVHVDTVLTCVAADKEGHILAGSNLGLYLTDGADWWYGLDRRDGMPIEEMRCIYCAPNGDVWGGTDQGAWRMRGGHFRYFGAQRWLPSNKVSAIWGDDRGRVWVETEDGYSCIEETQMTLGQKAKTFNDITQKWNNRRGYINERKLKAPGELAGSVFEVSDNDGLWNGIYVAAMAFRYGATKDPEAKRNAWESVHAMLELERLSGFSGFPARAVMTDEEIAAGATGFNAEETVRVKGETDLIWYRSPVEKNVWCKGDTSSDELDGHFLAWLTYFDLAATPEEKKQIAGTCRRVMENVIAGGYNLIGHTGRRTRWGVFGPKTLNEDPSWYDQRGLNSLELLSYLKVTAHITGEKRYEDLYDKLIHEDHYLLNTLEYRTRTGATWQAINHSDDEMGYMRYHALLSLEKNPERRRILLQSFRNSWEDSEVVQTLKQERSPFYNYFYGGLSGRPCAPDEAEETLQDWPMDRAEWTMKNSHRDDVAFKEGRGLRSVSELTRVLPISERFLHRWNSDPFSPDGGSNGREFDDGAAFLLGYWAGVYYGYLPVEK